MGHRGRRPSLELRGTPSSVSHFIRTSRIAWSLKFARGLVGFQIELNSARQHVLCQFFVNIKSVILTGLLSFIAAYSTAQTIFVEAEEFAPSSDGWKINKNPQTRGASSVMALNGASGDAKATAETMIEIPADGEYRIWVRHN